MIAALLGAIAALGLGGLTLYLSQRSRIPWKPLPGTAVKYTAFRPDYNPAKLARCVQYAAELLRTSTRTSAPEIQGLLAMWGVQVHQGEAWTDSFGRRIGGETVGYVSEVTESLDSLLHELLHAWELKFRGVSDSQHATWAAYGFWAADQQYRQWLKEQKK